MFKTITMASLAILLILSVACGAGGSDSDSASIADEPHSDHMVAQATLTAYYIDAAIRAGMTSQEINFALGKIASVTVIDEFWVSDEIGRIDFTNVPSVPFSFPTDPDAGTQAAPFAALLLGGETVIVQGAQPREADGAVFQYVGVAGVDKPRIVQVGFARE